MSAHNRHFIPGSLAAHENTLWVCERTRPLLVCVTDVGTSIRIPIPGHIRGFEPVGYKVRTLYADESGCWVRSQDGRVHVAPDGTVTPLAERDVVPDPVETTRWSISRPREMNRYTFVRNGRVQWAEAPVFPKDHVELPAARQLFVTTTREFLASAPGALDAFGEIELQPASTDELFGTCVLIPVDPADSIGDPIVWALKERDRIRRENASPNLVDVVLEGSFPFTTLIFMFKTAELPGRVLARKFSLFDRDGGPGLWRGAPSMMFTVELHIMESGGAERIERRDPARDGITWV
ncbi:hypothetical protein GCM10007304_46650 [Rhodococcoides trifolii]|uniref:Uncharacterized protein n=1 Tax=Rhodococcoides trifolii TaxID=908250 RepID=A0A917G8B2_9NOCA|nr:hypothetical protein [Rhodococcus trifolii]GGG27486.1 hypothetical protein GCM10007304_46650 [Rhodococcus trifolii]